ncbi:hypothetical protein ACHAWO_013234 [Cyclotella atomus]|uniref:MYND-type domain-containing protein n=1 Tax=Cyclotella atomus TaxID=382360 RepID=A0ABD3QKT3_9STRA
MSLPNPSTIKQIAAQHGFTERRDEVSSTLFFIRLRDKTLINVFYTTGGVMTKLSHLKSGYNELWRSDAYHSVETLAAIFKNPRIHTGQGYRKASGAKRGCIKCGLQKKREDYSKNQWRKGVLAKCSDCIGELQIGGDAAAKASTVQPSDIEWNTITDAITCDAEGCNKTSPTIKCNCAAPQYYCSETCKRRHRQEHREDCRDLEYFRLMTSTCDDNVNSGLCNATPATKSQQRGYAMATMLSGKKTIETLLLQAEYIHQEDGNWLQAINLYQRGLMMGGYYGENLNPTQCRMTFMGLGRCNYELHIYEKAIDVMQAAIEMNRGFPHVHKYVALSHEATGKHHLAIKTMKEAVLYEAPWSDEIIRANKELLYKLMNGHNVGNVRKEQSRIDAHFNTNLARERIDVFYGRTDGTIGYKQYSAVVVETAEVDELRYFNDLYDPLSKYEILYEVPPGKMPELCKKAGVPEPNTVGWIKAPLKEVILDYYKTKNRHGSKHHS